MATIHIFETDMGSIYKYEEGTYHLLDKKNDGIFHPLISKNLIISDYHRAMRVIAGFKEMIIKHYLELPPLNKLDDTKKWRTGS